jgi:hypothetical protein
VLDIAAGHTLLLGLKFKCEESLTF